MKTTLLLLLFLVSAFFQESAYPAETTAEGGQKKQEEKGKQDDKAKPYKPPSPPGSKEFLTTRTRMVRQQIELPKDGRKAVRSREVLEALRAAPRHVFVPANMRKNAYQDSPLPIGHGQTISQPYMVAWMTEQLELKPDSKVLEIGTGSGYQAAVLAHLTPRVYTVEIIKPLAEKAKKTLTHQGYTDIEFLYADGYHGWKEKGPFDAIIVTCAAGHLPPRYGSSSSRRVTS